MKIKWTTVPVLFLFIVVFGYTGTLVAQEKINWTPLFKGIQFAHLKPDNPLLKISILRININAQGIEFHTTGRHPEYEDTKKETDRRTTVDFLQEDKLSVAINGNFYSPFNRSTTVSRGPSNVIGLAIADGIVVSKPEQGFPSFIMTKKGEVQIRQVKPDEPLEDIQIAVSGNGIVLTDEKVVTNNDKSVHPRSAIGISRDKRYVYFMTIDGRQKDYSVGATMEQVGSWLKTAGASEGLNLDGGGSTTMVWDSHQGKPSLLNRPVGLGAPNTLRHNANNIGVRAKKIP